jgi:hypothetical protein
MGENRLVKIVTLFVSRSLAKIVTLFVSRSLVIKSF